MHRAFVDPEKCNHCVECRAARTCPYKAINRIDSIEPSVVDATYCRGCGDCMTKCVGSAIVLRNS